MESGLCVLFLVPKNVPLHLWFSKIIKLMSHVFLPVCLQELDPCIGCMQTSANIKLLKNCQEPNEGECQQCYCRPMWCLTCMGKWFASRQDQQHPETWLASRVPCPTCRAKFCILDVCVIRWTNPRTLLPFNALQRWKCASSYILSFILLFIDFSALPCTLYFFLFIFLTLNLLFLIQKQLRVISTSH